ncbi:hypothetical protein [Kitasatospora purpeofusca]|uniref:hypothetical protein n=1 Tax=Kitasatospora purpeofusca TaxID=67352 RepID=UPI0036A696B2
MSTEPDRSAAAYAMVMMLTRHERLPQPESDVYEYMTGSGAQGWGVRLILRDSIGKFEHWREALDLEPVVDFERCHQSVWLTASGEYEGVRVHLLSMAEVPDPDDPGE